MSGDNVTNKKSNSLYTYRDGIDANSNKGWQQYNSSVSSQSQMAAYNTPLFNSASGYPSVNGWPNNWTSSDPILNFGSTSTDLNCGGSGFTNVLGYITGGLAAATGLLGLGAGIAGLCKKDKSGSSSSEAADSTLASLVESANNYDKDSDQGAMQNTANCLAKQIDNVGKKLETAQRNKSTAERTLANYSKEKNDWEIKLSTFDADKGQIEADILDIDSQIAALDPKSPNYQNDKNKLEKTKQEKQDKLKTEYSDAKRKQITDQITRIEKEEDKWKVTLAEANQDIEKLPSEKKSAEKALKRLNKLIIDKK